MWDDDELDVDLRYAHSYFLHFAVRTAISCRWELTTVYAPPTASKRRSFWEKLYEVKIKDPWLIIGDFNCVLNDEERSSQKGTSTSFQAWVG